MRKSTKLLASITLLGLSNLALAAGTIPTKDKSKKDYHTLATVSLVDAVGAALTKVPGKAVDAELDSEKGFLVYEVKVIGDDGSTHKLEVDAGNKEILKDDVKKGIH
ncbi:MAG: hypothetical protein EOP07_00180 [Proteobacteria bacterium]|nr:MAG: hypothetical protein EOP07_00180 [Pseudomonadota bacterium]